MASPWAVLRQQETDLIKEGRAALEVAKLQERTLTAEEVALDNERQERLGLVRANLAIEERYREEQRQEQAVVSTQNAPTPFRSLGEQLIAVRQAALNPHRPDERLLNIQAATGASEGVSSDGGFAVQHDFSSELLKNVHAAAILAAKAKSIPISTNSNGLKINGVDETSRATGSRWGGVQAYWTGEAGALTGSKPKYRQITLELQKLTALYYATDELIQDAAALGVAAGEAFTEEFAFKIDDALVRGTGAGMPLGVIGHAGTVSVAKETNQAGLSIVKENIDKMWSRQMNPGNAEWFINRDCWPSLFAMSQAVGVGGVPVFLPPGGLSVAPYGMLYGRPVTPIEQCETLGTAGDIIFGDYSQYMTVDKGGIQTDSSIHVAFLTDELVFRWILRYDGQPIRNSAITPYKGTNTISPFITLATRA